MCCQWYVPAPRAHLGLTPVHTIAGEHRQQHQHGFPLFWLSRKYVQQVSRNPSVLTSTAGKELTPVVEQSPV